jgi:hypothetical protein
MTRDRLRRAWTVLVLIAGWAALVATSPPRSTVESDEFTGSAMLTPSRTELRIPYDIAVTQAVEQPGGAGLTVDVMYSWAGVASPPGRLPASIETAAGRVEIDRRQFSCSDICVQPGELVFRWPPHLTDGSVLVSWVVSAALTYDTHEPPTDAVVEFEMQVPPAEIEEKRLNPTQAMGTPIQREKLTVQGSLDRTDTLRISWPGWYFNPKDEPISVLLRWGAQSALLTPGLAVEIPVPELCSPACEAEVTYFFDREPLFISNPWDLIAPLTTTFLGNGSAQITLQGLPVSSAVAPPISTEITAPPDPGQISMELVVSTSPVDDEIAPVAVFKYEVDGAEDNPWVDRDGLRVRVGEESIADIEESRPRAPGSTLLPLQCDHQSCHAEVPVVVSNELSDHASVALSVGVEVFHPELTGHAITFELTEPR